MLPPAVRYRDEQVRTLTESQTGLTLLGINSVSSLETIFTVLYSIQCFQSSCPTFFCYGNFEECWRKAYATSKHFSIKNNGAYAITPRRIKDVETYHRIWDKLAHSRKGCQEKTCLRCALLQGTQAEATCPLVFLCDFGEVQPGASPIGARSGVGYGATCWAA